MKEFFNWVRDIVLGSDDSTLKGPEVIAEYDAGCNVQEEPLMHEMPALVLC